MSRPQEPGATTPTAKMSKFLRPEWRDRPRSSSGDGAVTSSSESPRMSRIIGKKGSKLFGKNRDEEGEANKSTNNSSATSSAVGISEPPVIIEPPSNSKPRPRPPRPSNTNDNSNGPSYPNAASSSTSAPSGTSGSLRNVGEMSARLSGWFSHTFSGSSTDLSLPNILSSSSLSASQVLAGSPKSKTAHPLIMAAKQGKDHLDKAMRYLLDSDAQPDKSTDKIWLLGEEHPGYEPPPPPTSMPPPTSSNPTSPTSTLTLPTKRNHRRDSTDSRTKSPSSFRNPIPITHSNSSTQSLSSAVSSTTVSSNGPNPKTGISWPSEFYSDYTSRVWLTYRNTFPPIRDTSLASLEPIQCSTQGSHSSTDISGPLPSPLKAKWPWGTEKGWTSDAGWGCMLRTGQSLLANALIHLHLSRSWRRPTQSSFTPEYVQYIRILTWFLDTPSPLSPFGVHRMALAGKELGKEVGSWFGPSTAAGAIKRLVGEFEDAGLEVVVAVDSVIYQTDVYAASCTPRGASAAAAANGSGSAVGSSKKKSPNAQKWGDRAVLVLVGIRLGIDGVNPIYYDSVKALFTFPQSVGIAGGRPSSSYYFVGSQGDSLFYLDPHHTRPAVPLRPPPSLSTFDEISMASTDDGLSLASSRLGKRRGSDLHARGHASTPDTSESDRRSSTKRLSIRRASINRVSSYQQQQQQQVATPTSPSSVNSGSSISQPSAPVSVAGSHAHSQSHSSYSGHSTVPLSSSPLARTNMPPSSHRPTSASPTRVGSSSAIPLSPSSSGFPQSPSTASSTGMGMPLSPSASSSTLDPMSAFLATAYPLSELRTFHCERVRKMPLSGLDPSMLLGFLCRDEKDWKDLRERVAEMAKSKKAIFSIQDEPPVWPDDDDDDLDLESASSDQDAEEVESPVGGEGDDDAEDNELEIKRRPAKLDAAKVDLGNDSADEDDEADELNAVTPIAPSTKFATSRHDTIVGRARPEMAAAAAAASKTATLHPHHDRKDSRENDGDDDDELDDDDDDWVDPIKPSPPLASAAIVNGQKSKSSSSIGSARRGSTDSGSRIRGKGDDASITPRPTSASQPISPTSSVISMQQSRMRPAPKELPAIPTTIVSISRESSRPSSSSRRLSQVALSDAPVPFPTRSSDHRKQSSASSRSATSSSSTPASPGSGSSPASHYPGHGASNSSSSNSHSHSHAHSHHRQQHSGNERDATGYPFPGSVSDESGTTSSDSGPSSDAWGGDEKHGLRGSLVPKRERRTTVGRSGALAAPMPVAAGAAGAAAPVKASTVSGHAQPHGVERMSSVKAKDGGRTTSGGVRAVWKDEDGDDF